MEKETKIRMYEKELAVRFILKEKKDKWAEEEIEIRSMEAEQLVPKRFHQYLKVFEQIDSEQMPIRKPWDHAINLKEGYKPRKEKMYPLSWQERDEVEAFTTEQLQKGYIQPSKSPQMAPVFFVPKKDRKKHMVQDY